MRPAGIGYANAVFGAVIALWTYRVARGRLAGAGAFVLGVYAVLLITAPFSLGYSPLAFTYAMLYNRYGYALLGIILLNAGYRRCERLTESCKAPVVVLHRRGVGAAPVSKDFVCDSCRPVPAPLGLLRRRPPEAVAGFVRRVWHGGRDRALLPALRPCRHVSRSGLRGHRAWHHLAAGSTLSPVVVIESIPLLLLAAVSAAGTGETGSRDALWRRARVWLFVLAAVCVGGLLLSTNHQAMSLPLDGFAAVVLVDTVVRRQSRAAMIGRAGCWRCSWERCACCRSP